MTREEILTIAKPILFNGDMVRAILDNMKSTTRRVVKGLDGLDVYRAEPTEQSLESGDLKEWEFTYGFNDSHAFYDACLEVKSPYKVGDYLYVRETWMVQAAKRFDAIVRIGYRAGGQITTINFPNGCTDSISRVAYDSFVSKWRLDRWYPSIHMPKETARIFLRVTDVRVERLNDITEAEAVKEGLYKGWHYLPTSSFAVTAKQAFMWVWDMTIKLKNRHKYGWSANPWVWVIEFERVEVSEE